MSSSPPGPGGRRLWLVIAGAAGAAIVLFVALVAPLQQPSHRLPFLPLVGLFALAEMAVVRVSVGPRTHTWSLVEVPLALGLLTAPAGQVVLAWVLGGAITLAAFRRQPPAQLAYNVTSFALEAITAVLIFHWLAGSAGTLGAASVAGVLVASVGAAAISVASVHLAVVLTEGRRSRDEWVGYSIASLTSSAVTASVILVGVVLVRTDPAAAWLLAVPVFGAFVGRRLLLRRDPIDAAREQQDEAPVPAERDSDGAALQPPLTRDPLTGLADRPAVLRHLEERVGEGGGGTTACLFVRVDDPGGVGSGPQEVEDQLLIVTAQRLAGCLREGDLAGRVGAGDLAVVARVDAARAQVEAAALARRVGGVLERPASVGARLLSPSVSVGVVVARDGAPAADLLAQAAAGARGPVAPADAVVVEGDLDRSPGPERRPLVP